MGLGLGLGLGSGLVDRVRVSWQVRVIVCFGDKVKAKAKVRGKA